MARSTPARWRDIASDLQVRIEEGDLSEPEESGGRRRVPPEKDLEVYYKASKNTVRSALSWLQGQGYVVSEQGKGTFVIHRPKPIHVTLSGTALRAPEPEEGAWYNRDTLVPGHRVDASRLTVEIQERPDKIAYYLQAEPGTEFVSRHQELFLDGRPWALQTSFYPLEFVQQGATRLLRPRDIPEGAVAYLNDTLGYSEVGLHDEIKARAPDENEKRFFDLGESTADVVFENVRTTYSESGTAFRLTMTVWPAGRVRLHYNDGKVPEEIVRSPRQPISDGSASQVADA